MKNLVYLLLIIFSIPSCKTKTGSTQLVVPTDSTTLYFPLFDSAKAVLIYGSTMEDSLSKIWDSQELFDFREPILYNYAGGTEVYRFTWIRSFAYSVCFRLQKHEDSILLFTKINNGYAYERGKLILNEKKNITRNEWNEFKSLLKETNFWNLKEYEPALWTDASSWILEGVSHGNYHWVSRADPQSQNRVPDFTKTCEYLIALSGIDFKKTE